MAPDGNDQNKMEVFTAREVRAEQRRAIAGSDPPGNDGKAARSLGLVESHPKAPVDGSDRFFRAVCYRPGRIHP